MSAKMMLKGQGVNLLYLMLWVRRISKINEITWVIAIEFLGKLMMY